MIQIDGSFGEGGGQIVRTALALSTITQRAFEIDNIRASRPQPGLKQQHLTCIKALEELTGAKSGHAELGSTKLRFIPGQFKSKNAEIDIGTAGSIPLLLQAILPPLVFSGKKVRLTIKGGTDTKWAMPIDYLANVLVPHLRRWADIQISTVQRGYYPKGQGEVDLKVESKFDKDSIKQVSSLEQYTLMHIKGVSNASNDLQAANVADRQAQAAKMTLKNLNVPISIQNQYSNTASPGSILTLWAIFTKDPEDMDVHNPIILGADILGEKGKKAEVVGKEAADKLLDEIQSRKPVDQHLADNLIPYLAVSGGKIAPSKITDHTKSNIYAASQFVEGLSIDDSLIVANPKLFKSP